MHNSYVFALIKYNGYVNIVQENKNNALVSRRFQLWKFNKISPTMNSECILTLNGNYM